MILDTFPALAALVEKRLEQAVARGEFSGLPGEGRPLEFDDDSMVPEDERIACRVLKTAGVLPPGLQAFASITQLIEAAGDTRVDGSRRLGLLLLQLEAAGHRATAANAWQDYEAAIRRRLARTGMSPGRGATPAEDPKTLAEDS
jgi:hypothetical protein